MLTAAALQERGRKVCMICADIGSKLTGIIQIKRKGQAGIKLNQICHILIQIIAQFFAAGRMTELPEGFCLDLADPFTGDVEFLADFLQRPLVSVVQAEAQAEHLFLTGRQGVQDFPELLLHERMGCGFGACMGCSTKTKNGNKRICKEGPVLRTEEILW